MLDELRAASPQARGLLLVRLFFGVTFIYAGLDKLLDPSFFDPAAPTSIQAQFVIFERVSPLAALVRLSEPLAVPIGALIALGEIGAGLGALSGLLFRLAALGGASLALMFYLTASWSTHPYYLGPDLPYALGWLALLVAGHGGLWVPHIAFGAGRSPGDAAQPVPAGGTLAAAISRRQVLELGTLSGLTLLVGATAASLRLLLPGQSVAQPSPTPAPTGSSVAEPSATATATAAGMTVATVAAVQQRGYLDITVPVTAPAALFPGDPAVIIGLADGSFAAYDALCTHEGCTVSYDRQAAVIYCPCHGAEFDPADHGQVIVGPARRALPELPLVIDAAGGTIKLATG
jgi:thiosulfate dehydrogenase [quinone] large subunit